MRFLARVDSMKNVNSWLIGTNNLPHVALEVVKTLDTFMAEWTFNVHIFWIETLQLILCLADN